MKFFKKNVKLFIGILIGAILACGLTVYATNILASQVTYTNNKNVETALNELYTLSQKRITVEGTIDESQLTADANGWININVGFQPRYVYIYKATSESPQDIVYNGESWNEYGWKNDNSMWYTIKQGENFEITSQGFKYDTSITNLIQFSYIAVQ